MAAFKKAPPPWVYWECPEKDNSDANRSTNGSYPFPSRHLVVGPANTGKDSLMKTIVSSMFDPPIERIVVVTLRPDTSEFDGWADEVHAPSDPLTHDAFQAGGEGSEAPRTVLIISELEFGAMSKPDIERLTTFFRAGSHMRLSVIISHQVLDGDSGIPLAWRKNVTHVHVTGLSAGRSILPSVAKLVSKDVRELHQLAQLCRSQFEPLSIDTTVDRNSSLHYRVCLQPVTRKHSASLPTDPVARMGGSVVVIPRPGPKEPERRPLMPEDQKSVDESGSGSGECEGGEYI